MIFEQIYLGCLAQASYLVGGGGDAAVVDPRRDVEPYLEAASRHGVTIRYVIETHVHADFVSGHRELAARTGATIVFGRRAEVGFPHLAVAHGDEIPLGPVVLRVLETPGHTPESISLLVLDAGRPVAVFTGDTLFIGDVGRPDLVAARGASAESLAGQLYDSLHATLLALPDDVVVYPAHGAGSLCGRSLSSDTSSTIGRERRFNYALAPMPREAFVRMMTTDLPELPGYFGRDAEINRLGPTLLADLPPLRGLEVEEVAREMAAGAVVLDTRDAAAFGAGHVPGAVNVGLAGQFASWAGAVIGLDAPVVLVAEDPARAEEARLRLARVGIEKVGGVLSGGVEAWAAAGRPVATLRQIPAYELRHRFAEREGKPALIDVRRPAEWSAGHIDDATHLPLSDLPARLASGEGLPAREAPVAVICQSGYRSSLAGSLLERAGFRDLYNVVGGMNAWEATR